MRLLSLAAIGLLAAACTGEATFTHPGVQPEAPPPPQDLGDPTDPLAVACAVAPVDVPVAPLRRLNAEEYRHTAGRLFSTSVPLTLETTDAPILTALEVEKFHGAASTLVATKGHHRFAPCLPSGTQDRACVERFIQDFGLRAFRRPVTAEEQAWLVGVYERTRALPELAPGQPANITFQEALDTVAQVMVQAPQHIFLREEGEPDATLPAGLKRLTGFERATRLSYLLTSDMPDEPLLAAAGAGALDAPEGIREQANRLLETPAGKATVRRFAARYLDLDVSVNHPSLETNPKDAARFPFDSPTLRAAMRKESESLFERVFYDEGARFETLLTSTRALVTPQLAALYGVPFPSGGQPEAWVELDASQRSGVFTRAAFLTQKANQRYQSPIHRGVHLYKRVLCQPLGPPPPNANNVPAIPGSTGAALSTRQLTEVKTQDAACRGCHIRINPLGYTLEHYDAMGRWQTQDTGTTSAGTPFAVDIDANVALEFPFSGTVNGGVELSRQLSQSPLAQGCMAERWFSEVTQREVAAEDFCSVYKLQAAFKKSGDMRALVLDVITSAPALYTRTPPL